MKRRSFSGKSADLSEEDRKANIESTLGLSSSRLSSRKRVVLQGESLESIAENLYQDSSFWILLALKNDLPTGVDRSGNPISRLRRGQKLKLPDAYELESFERDPDAPVVVALYTDELDFLMPLTRLCWNCRRETLAMAAECVSCGADMDNPESNDEEEQEELEEARESQEGSPEGEEDDDGENDEDDDEDDEQDEEDDEQDEEERKEVIQERPAGRPLEKGRQVEQDQDGTLVSPLRPPQIQDTTLVSLVRPPQEQDQTIVAKLRPPEAQQQALWQSQSAALQPQPGTDSDNFWTPNPSPELLDRSVKVSEFSAEGETRGLRIVLQQLVDGQWLIVYEYQVFSDEVVIIQNHSRKGPARTRKSLPARLARKMAWNHFRGNWPDICAKFWAP
jgi:hypothetical protein